MTLTRSQTGKTPKYVFQLFLLVLGSRVLRLPFAIRSTLSRLAI